MNTRYYGVPIAVFTDAETGTPRCVNALHIQTFVMNPVGHRTGTLITFASGDSVTVTDDFHAVVNTFIAGTADG
jgi:uncharacterized protein YlzI (FlbEa/FlbD family)